MTPASLGFGSMATAILVTPTSSAGFQANRLSIHCSLSHDERVSEPESEVSTFVILFTTSPNSTTQSAGSTLLSYPLSLPNKSTCNWLVCSCFGVRPGCKPVVVHIVNVNTIHRWPRYMAIYVFNACTRQCVLSADPPM